MGKRIHGILLAAGFSQRFKGNKLLYLLNGKELYLYLTERLEILLKNGVLDSLVLVQRIINNCYIKPMPLPLH